MRTRRLVHKKFTSGHCSSCFGVRCICVTFVIGILFAGKPERTPDQRTNDPSPTKETMDFKKPLCCVIRHRQTLPLFKCFCITKSTDKLVKKTLYACFVAYSASEIVFGAALVLSSGRTL